MRKVEQHPVDFDIERMAEALKGPRTTMPEDLKRADFRAWMAEQAKIVRERRP